LRSFLQQRRATGAYKDAVKGIRFLDTPCYKEFEAPLDSGSFCVIYIVPRNEHSVFVCACMPDNISAVVNTVVMMDSQRQRATLQTYQEAWPLLMDLRSNGLAERYSPAALTDMEDPDHATNRWFLATVVGNLPSLPGIDALGDARMLKAIIRVIETAEAVIEQVSCSPIDADRLANVRIRDDLSSGAKTAAKFFKDNVGPMVDLFGFFAEKNK
jgi:hypothetical protein